VMAPLILWLMACHREGILTEEETGLPLAKGCCINNISVWRAIITIVKF
jgi:hypothetical protein